MERPATTLVLANDKESRTAWRKHFGRVQRVIVLNSAAQMMEAMAYLEASSIGRLERVVFDHSITPEEYLSIVASAPSGFRGDIVWFRPDGSGYLSFHPTPDGGRSVLEIERADLAMYLMAHFVSDDTTASLAATPRWVSLSTVAA